jgi:hypothetical protein
VPQQPASVIDRITALLDEIEAGRHPGRAVVEEMLTDGYALALALEGECARLERRISDEAVALFESGPGERAPQFSALGGLLSRRRTELVELRGVLDSLKNGPREAKVA